MIAQESIIAQLPSTSTVLTYSRASLISAMDKTHPADPNLSNGNTVDE